MRLPILGVAAAGDAFAKTADGRTVFVAGAIPGDEYDLTVDDQGKVQLATRVAASPHRRPSFCAVSGCGGCAWREHDLLHATIQKRDLVVETLQRHQIQIPTEVGLVGDGQLAYRHRVRVHASKGALGYVGASSHQIQRFTTCEVVRPALAKALQALGKRVPKTLIADLDLVHGDDDRLGLTLTLDKKSDLDAAITMARDAVTQGLVAGAQVFDHRGAQQRVFGDPIVVMQHVSGAPFALEAGVFSQAHWRLNAALVSATARAVGDAHHVLELHAGAGNLTLGYAATAQRITCTELDERATMLAKRNLAKYSHIATFAERDEQALKRATDADVLVLDPPRTGADKVSRSIAAGQGAFKRIVYVSCDPKTLARDLQILAPRYTLKQLSVFDMFPGTPHVETLAVLV